MSKERYKIDAQTGEILDTHFVMTPEDIVDRLNYLEEQLKNAIALPKEIAELKNNKNKTINKSKITPDIFNTDGIKNTTMTMR